MSTQKQKFELFARLQTLGFIYEEAVSLRRIELTLHRWAEAECNGEIEREEALQADGSMSSRLSKPYRVHRPIHGNGEPNRYPIADREAGALRRLKAIVDARNERQKMHAFANRLAEEPVLSYHQTDPRGCMLYLVKRSDLPTDLFSTACFQNGWSIKHRGNNTEAYSCRFATENAAKEFANHETLSAYYTSGLAVCC